MSERLIIGTRVSPLAMAQARFVQSLLLGEGTRAPDAVSISGFTTTGDQIQDRALTEPGGKGLFTKELDEALLDRRIDLAVHSMKDLPTRLPPGLALICVPDREDVRDGLIARDVRSLSDLPAGAVIGTASLRRQAQLLYRRPDLKVETLRGSVETRLRRIEEGRFAATFLALAGLRRLGLAGKVSAIVPPEEMPPAAGQGALAIVARADDLAAASAVRPFDKTPHAIAVTAERAFLDVLDGSCRTPIAAWARIKGDSLIFLGEFLTPDGSKRWRREETINLGADPHADAERLGRALGAAIRKDAGL